MWTFLQNWRSRAVLEKRSGSRIRGGRVGKYAWPEPEREATGRGRGQQGALRAPPEGDEWMLDRAWRGQASKRSHTSNERLIFSNLAHIHAWRAHLRCH